MKRLILILSSVLLFSLVTPALALAHSGRTDSNGGHNCSAKSISKGLCTGYHYHNGGSSSKGSSSKGSSATSSSAAKITKEKIINNEYATAPHCKKIEDKFKSSDTYYNYYERIWDCNYYTDKGSVFTYLDLSLYLDKKYQSLNKPLISIKDSSYISVRDFSQLFGYSLDTDKAGNIILKKDKTTIEINIENNKISLNGKATAVVAVKADNSYYIPVRSAMKWANGKITAIDKSNLYISTK